MAHKSDDADEIVDDDEDADAVEKSKQFGSQVFVSQVKLQESKTFGVGTKHFD